MTGKLYKTWNRNEPFPAFFFVREIQGKEAFYFIGITEEFIETLSTAARAMQQAKEDIEGLEKILIKTKVAYRSIKFGYSMAHLTWRICADNVFAVEPNKAYDCSLIIEDSRFSLKFSQHAAATKPIFIEEFIEEYNSRVGAKKKRKKQEKKEDPAGRIIL